MDVQEAFSVDELYEKVKDYDLVLTVEAPLADALNNRLSEAQLGVFASTPKRLIWNSFGNEDLADERELFIKVARETDLTWKESFYLIKNILSCWRETGRLRGILDFEDFDDDSTKRVISVIESTPNLYSALEDFEVDEDLSVAVIGLYQFNALDEAVLPGDYDVFDVFKGNEIELSEFSVFSTVTGLIQGIRDNVSRGNADDVAIVISPDSGYSSLVKSVLQAEEIPFMLGRGFSEDEGLRTILSLLRLSLSGERLRVREVQPVLRQLGLSVPFVHNDEYLNDLEISELSEFKRILRKARDSTFREVLQECEGLLGDLTQIREEFNEIGILSEEVSSESVNRLEYYLDSFDIQVSGTSRGVIIASPKSASYIDRPIVFYLGMNSTWTHKKPEDPWVSESEFEEKNLRNFKLLLQNGEQQHYLVRASSLGEDIIPCLYFDELIDGTLESFRDLPNKEYWGLKQVEGQGFEKKELDVKTR
ncbi:MAG: hypothetical protein KGY45_03195, partial [Hadesarchaea archaeon]|nr:hypothetical protein [Hadesarchaea archaeon]